LLYMWICSIFEQQILIKNHSLLRVTAQDGGQAALAPNIGWSA
jgi:hypothetical protein